MKKRMNVPAMANILNPNNSIGDSVAKARIGTELWRFFLVLALIFACAEMILARRVSSKSIDQ
jgi:hypothetical protein